MLSLKRIRSIPNPVLKEKAYFVMVSKKNPRATEIKKIFDEEFAKMMASGTIKKITNNYFE